MGANCQQGAVDQSETGTRFLPGIANIFDTAINQTEFKCLGEPFYIDPVTTAAILLKSRAIRLEQFREGQPDIDDLSWHIFLDLMVSMNTGKSVTAHILPITHNVAMSSMSRYVAYLISVGLIDKNSDAEEEERAPLKLSASGVALTSKALEKIGHELVNF